MPVCRARKLIFVHIPKTGGSSIEKALGLFGRDNCGSNEPSEEILYGITGPRAMQHYTAAGIRKALGPGPFRDYFKFAFVRNPYDRIVSAYHFHCKYGGESLSFEDYVVKRLAHRKLALKIPAALRPSFKPDLMDDHIVSQHRFVLNAAGRPLVDFIGRFENLPADFEKIRARFGIESGLPHINKSERAGCREYYTPRALRIVRTFFWRDFAAFGYEM